MPAFCRDCGRVLQVTGEGQAKCVGCGLAHTFDRLRRSWLSDSETLRMLNGTEGAPVAETGVRARLVDLTCCLSATKTS